MAIFCVPTFVAFGPIYGAPEGPLRLGAVAIAPLLFATAMPLVAGLLSRLTIDAVVPGSFERDLSKPNYGRRRLYGVCWTAIYYCPQIYHFVLTIPWLKRATFRLFGYQGALDVTLFPDTWIRDLPLLELGSGAYVSNKATMGTNICLPGNKIVVEPIIVGRNAMVGHLCIVGPGANIGEAVEMAVSAAVGLRSRIGPRTTIGPSALVYHGVQIGADCRIGGACRIGSKSAIADGITIPFGTVVPPRSRIASQADVKRLWRDSAQSEALATHVASVLSFEEVET